MDKEQINEFLKQAGNQLIENLVVEMKDYVRNVVIVNLEESSVSLLGKLTLREAFELLIENIDNTNKIFKEMNEKGDMK